MKTIRKSGGVILYEQERGERVLAAMEKLARVNAQTLDDETAAQVGDLFDEWSAGTEYTAGMRISDSEGRLYRVVQSHTAQADWPIDATPALYTPLGVTVEEPDAVPEWRQPLGAADAYAKGDRVRYKGRIYVSLVDGNAYAPDVSGWEEEKA